MSNELFKAFEKAESDRHNYDTEWREISDHLSPESRGFNSTGTDGYVDQKDILDATPERAAEDLSSAMVSMLATESKKWGRLALEEVSDDYEVKASLQVATDRVTQHLARSKANFYTCFADVTDDLVTYGQGYAYMHSTIEGKNKFVRFCRLPPQDCFLTRDSYGDIFYFFRKYKVPKDVFLVEFGDLSQADCDEHTKKQIKESREKEICVLHCIMKKEQAEKLGCKPKTKKDYVSVYYVYEHKIKIWEDGYSQFPIVAPSWKRKAGSSYGRGPGHKALPDIKVLNNMIRSNLGAAETMVTPPMAVPYDLMLDPNLDLSPKAMAYISMQEASLGTGLLKPEPIITVSNLPVSLEMEDRRRNSIAQSFFSDLLVDFKNAEMSATETSVRENARVRKLTNYILRIQDEFLAPAFLFVFNQLIEWKDLDFPESFELKVEFRSALFEANNAQKITLLERALVTLSNTKAIDPSILEAIKEEKFVQYIFDNIGADLTVLKSENELAEAKQARMESQQVTNMQGAAGAAKDLSQAMAMQQGGMV
jgi:hypothetical protein